MSSFVFNEFPEIFLEVFVSIDEFEAGFVGLPVYGSDVSHVRRG